MKLARDSSFLIAVPAVLIIAGSWWINTGSVSKDRLAGVHFALDGEAGKGQRDQFSSRPSASDEDVARALCGDTEGAATPLSVAPEQPPMAVWSGTIRDRNGMPIGGATVRFRIKGGSKLGDDTQIGDGEWITLTAGADGRIAFPYLPGQRFDVEVRAAGFGVEKFEVEGQIGQDLTLDHASAVDGRVVHKNGTPMAGATVAFENANERYEVVTGPDGRFRFDGVGARAARIYVAGEQFVATERGLESLPPGQSVGLSDFLVGTGAMLHGSVVDLETGVAVGGADIVVRDRLTSLIVSTGVTNALGHFQFNSINPSRQYIISAFGAGFSFDSIPQLFSSQSVTLPVQATWTLAVSVRNPSGDGISGARLQLKRSDGLSFTGSQNVIAMTNAGGFAAFAALSASLSYRVIIDRAGYATMDLGPATAEWNAATPLVVAMVEGRTMSGVVVDTDGYPVPGVTIRAQRADGAPAPALFAATNMNGAFTFDSLYPGHVSLVTFRSGYDNTRVVVEVPAAGSESPVTLTIPSLNGLVIR